MAKANDRMGEPRLKPQSSPKHSGYGTDRIGGGGQKEFTGGVKELESQGTEFHHMIDGRSKASNTEHREHVKGYTEKALIRKPE